MPGVVSSLTSALGVQVQKTPDRTAYIFLADGEEEQDRLTWAALDARARAIAAALERSCRPGDRALLLYSPGLDFIAAFFGCLYAGVIAVPAYPPRSPRMMPRLQSILADAQPAVALAAGASLQRVRGWLERTPEVPEAAAALSWLATDELDAAPAGWEPPVPDGDAVAFLQYTSGSTSTPKGVMVTQANLVHNQRVIQDACGHSEDSVFVSWLPLYHDLGLIGNLLQATWVGAPCVLMAPVAFLQNPSRWLRAVSHYRGTTSGGPNFAYDLCVRRMPPAEIEKLDLSCWQVAFNGAEPVREETLARFAEAFAPAGFRSGALYPCYGLAEATLMVSGGRPGEETVVRELGERRLVGCGHVLLDLEVAIVDPDSGTPRPLGDVGEIWVAGDSVARGYWNRPEETVQAFGATLADGRGPWLRTGDLGALAAGELFVAGRLKDLIILRGRNHYPQDLEATAGKAHPALSDGTGAAFAIDSDGEERLVIVHEVDRHAARPEEIAAAVRQAIAEEHEALAWEVALVPTGGVPRTTSGKVQRRACRDLYLRGELRVLGASRLSGISDGAADEDLLAAALPGSLDWLLQAFAVAAQVDPARVDPDRPLSASGLDSLAAVELKHSVEEATGVSLPLQDLLEGMTLRELERRVSDGAAAPAALLPLAGAAAGEHPLSWNQCSLWFLHRLAPESAAYNIAGAARLQVEDSVDSAALGHAVQALVDRHPMLRATFADTPDGPVQRVAERAEAAFAVLEVHGWSDEEVRRQLHTEAFRPFDLAAGPLLRTLLLRRGGESFFVLAVHHIAADFWSMTVLARELGALAAGEAPPPPPATLYTDFARRQRERLEGAAGDRLWEHWRERLTGTPQLDLPTDRPRQPVQALRGGSRTSLPSAERADAVHRLATAHGCTPFVALLAAWQAVLGRWSGQETFLAGAPMAGRSARAWSDVVGYFVNPVPLRADLSGDPAVRDLLERTRGTVLDALAHQELPFALLAERLQPERDPSRPPLVAAMLTFEKAPAPELAALAAFAMGIPGVRLDLGGLALESLPLAPPAAQLDLSLMAAELPGGLALSLQWDADLFDEATVGRMLGHLDHLLAGMADAGRPVAELPLLAAEERDQILLAWSGAESGAPAGSGCLHELFEAAAARSPQATALVAGDRRWTYDALNRQANRLAHHLRRLGAGPEQRVGVLMSRSGEMVAALLGILKAGAAYVPLDPAYPAEWLSFAAEDARIALLLTEERLAGKLAGWREVDALADAIALEPEENPEPLADPGYLAYVMYTSGSTGRPKGVALEHRAPVERMGWARAAFPPEALAGVLASTSICFDLSVFEIFVPLSWGGTVILAENALALPALLAAGEVTLINTVPSAMAELAAAELPPGLRTVNLAGEALPPQLAERIYRHAHIEQVLNLYGPTEDATYSTWTRIERGATRVSIGRPLPGTRAYVLDRHLGPVPGGVPGELFLAGAGGARGYLGRPDLTAERFLPDPFAAIPGGRLYRTGDLARWLASGNLEHLGRIDHQVKVRGFRIELEEIERVLREHPQVREAVVVVREAPAGGNALAAYVAPDEAAVADLRRHLGGRLPAYMVPSSFQLLPALPRTLNGKVDRKALPEPAPAEWGADDEPRTPSEEVVAAIWAELLGRPRIGRSERFFDLGGHSLLATRVLSRLRKVFGVELPLRALFERPSVAELSAAVEEARRGGVDRVTPPLVPVPRGRDLPLSFAQQRLWLIDQLEPGSPLYNIPVALCVEGPLRPEVLALCLGEIVRRHEALRTVFTALDGSPVQVIRPAAPFGLTVVDLSGLPESGREAPALALLGGEAGRPFDLTCDPLLRGVLLRLAEGSHTAVLTMHHIGSDGWSMGILIRELTALYAAFAEGRPSPLPELPVQYADFAVWQRQWLTGEVLERDLAWWRGQLAGTSGVLDLPTDHPRPAIASLRGAEHRFALDRELSHRLAALGRREGATPYMILAAALSALLSRLSGQRDLNLGSPIANRNRIETEGLIGFFVNTLVLRTKIGGEASFLDLLFQVREASLGAHAHQDLPFEKLVDELQPERDLSRSPLVQVALAVNNAPLPQADLEGLRLVPEIPPTEVAKFDLAFIFAEAADGRLAGALQYTRDLWDAPAALRLTRQFTAFLEALAAGPEQPLSSLAPLTTEERHQVLREWNDTADALRPRLLLHQLFAAQAEARPEALAAVWEGSAWSYRELAGRARRLAGLLRGVGVERGTPVGVWMERSLHMLAAVLGILETGGTYVPLDPAWPAERVETILAGTQAPAIVASRATLPALERLRWRLPRLRDAVCPDVEAPEPEPEAVDTASIRSVFDLVAERATDRVSAGGFVSSRTGLPFREAEVDEYRDRVLSLAEPWLRPGARVLEVGCGSGLILWEMARRVERCVGLDPSERTQERNRRHAHAEGIGNVELPAGFAHEIGERFLPASFDLVVLASTVQFFPGPRYLEKVVADALRLLAPGGALLLADVIDARREAAADRLALPEELFHDLGEAEIHHRTEGFANELGERYDVILRPGKTERSRRTWTGWHVERSPDTRLPATGSPEDIAYVIHTSGSTGLPKGIAVQHAPAVSLVHWVNRSLGVGPEDRLLFVTSLCFDLSVWDIFGLLAAGGTVHVASEAALREPAELVRLLHREPITIWDSAPAALQQLAPLFPPATGRPLRLVMLSGDWIPVPLPDQVRSAFPGARVISLGGATEATVWSNWYPVQDVDPRWPSIPYGRPIANARYHVLDEGLLPCPIGIPGDLHIGGGCLCVGYAGQPELTAAAFIPDPFAAEPGARLYRTGDRARFFTDGNLEFLGRVDQQVKIRGYRIELGEIEVALAGHPEVRACVVLARRDLPGSGGEPRLVAYVAGDAAAGALRQSLRERLPDYMVPAAFVMLAALPLTPNGKVDRQALPVPGWTTGTTAAAPRTATEELLAEIFADALEIASVGCGDDFFALGGHSLLAARLAARVRETFGVELPLRTLFEAPSVTELAKRLDASMRQDRGLAAPPLERASRALEPPLSFAQQSLWLIDRMEGGDAAYNVAAAVELAGRLDISALAGSFRDVVERHEILRTSFALRNGEPRQRIHSRVEVPPPLADLSALPLPEDRREEARQAVRRELGRPFDLERAPLLRTLLLRLAPDLHVLALCQHHAVSDAWSMGVLVRELALCYTARTRRERPALPALPVQYADWSHWQRQWLRGDALERLLAFWRGQLGSAPPSTRLPTARAAPAVRTSRGGHLTAPIPPALEPALRALARREGVTLFMLLLGAFETLLHASTEQEDLVLVVAVAGRDRLETEGLIGCFLNMLPLRASLAGDPPFRWLLQRVRETCLDAFAHQDLPFERLVAELRLHSAGGRSPFQIAFGVQSAPPPLPELPGLTVRPLDWQPEVARLDLTLWVHERPEGLSAAWTYSADLFERGEVERLHAAYEALLAAVVADPEARLRDLALSVLANPESTSAAHRRWKDLKKDKLRVSQRRSVRGRTGAPGGPAFPGVDPKDLPDSTWYGERERVVAGMDEREGQNDEEKTS